MWDIVSKEQTATYARVSIQNIDDYWYDNIVGMVEHFTGWRHLDEAQNIVTRCHGTGTPFLAIHAPINTITSIVVSQETISSSLYTYDWNKVYMINDDLNTGYANNFFKRGVKNVVVTYNVGGTSNLPTYLFESLQQSMLMCLKELIAIPRNEGSDQTLRKYRPDRTMMPEEVLKSYGVHGKIQGILKANLPMRLRVT